MDQLINNEKIVTEKNVFYLDTINYQEINLLDSTFKCRLMRTQKNLHFNSIWQNKIEKFNWIFTFEVLDCKIKQLIFYIGYYDEVTDKKVIYK